MSYKHRADKVGTPAARSTQKADWAFPHRDALPRTNRCHKCLRLFKALGRFNKRCEKCDPPRKHIEPKPEEGLDVE